MSRTLSHSEIGTAMTCQARHAFAYTGRLTDGQVLHRRAIAPILSGGRAWGAAVAAWHTFSGPLATKASFAAHEALRASYAADVDEQRLSGITVPAELEVEHLERLGQILDHYMQTSQRLPNLTRLEGEINMPIPSRMGLRSSSIYRFGALIDGYTLDDNGYGWIVEYKLRATLTTARLLELGRQHRWYAWALEQELAREGVEIPIVGVILDERLNEAPKPARIVKGYKDGFRPSHAVNQLTTPDSYLALCSEYGEMPHDPTVQALRERRWDQRFRIQFRPGELKEAGRELVSAAKLIRDLDSGELYPVRNAQPHLCRGCRYVEICNEPGDRLFVDTLYERRPPKRERQKEVV